jgi:photosystem II stability/assembly factor-like uncharacterized protein
MSRDTEDRATDDSPEEHLLAAWSRLSARSRPTSLVRRSAVRVRAGGLPSSMTGPATALAVVVAVVAIGLLGFGRAAAPAASMNAGGSASLVAIGPSQPSSGGASISPSAKVPNVSIPGLPTPTGSRAPFASVADGGLMTAIDGWALTHDALHLTHDGGRSWAVATPPLAAASRIVGAAFADVEHGWVVSETYPEQGATGELVVHLHRTDDGGITWETVELARVPSPGPSPTVGFPTFSILTSEHVFVMLALPTAPGYISRLYVTQDGGRTWERRSGVTEGGRFAFTDDLRGWAVRGDTETLVRTVDGGRSWSRAPLPALAIGGDPPRYPSIPVATPDGQLVLLTSSGRDGDPTRLFTSRDQGSTWATGGPTPANTYGSIAILSDGTWFLYGDPPQRSADRGATWEPDRGALEGGIGRITASHGQTMSALRSEPSPCGPLADCFVPTRLWISHDGGLTWRDATP